MGHYFLDTQYHQSDTNRRYGVHKLDLDHEAALFFLRGRIDDRKDINN